MESFLATLFLALVTPLLYPLSTGERVFIGYLFVAFLPFAYLAWKGNSWKLDLDLIWESCFPKELWKHPSTKLDFQYFFINTAFFTVLIVPFISSGTVTTELMHSLLQQLFGTVPKPLPYTLLAISVVTLLMAMLTDLAVYVMHYLQHRVPFLWEFHKVHHSAQVLTPITVYRMHPMDDFLTFLLGGVFTGIAGGAIQYLFHQEATVIQLAGLNAVFFLFYLCFYNLRHSHLWLHYPGGLGKLFISPAMHQIHHSSEARHWDTNFGLIFGLWDWAFGTLYLPKEKESFVLGIGEETADYHSLGTLYLLPFKKNWQRFRRMYEKMVLSRTSARQ